MFIIFFFNIIIMSKFKNKRLQTNIFLFQFFKNFNNSVKYLKKTRYFLEIFHLIKFYDDIIR